MSDDSKTVDPENPNAHPFDPDWPWDQPPFARALTTKKVAFEDHPVLVVTHYEEDFSWSFACGTTDDIGDALLVGMEEIISRDESLSEVSDLKPGYTARRQSPGAPWTRMKNDF